MTLRSVEYSRTDRLDYVGVEGLVLVLDIIDTFPTDNGAVEDGSVFLLVLVCGLAEGDGSDIENQEAAFSFPLSLPLPLLPSFLLPFLLFSSLPSFLPPVLLLKTPPLPSSNPFFPLPTNVCSSFSFTTQWSKRGKTLLWTSCSKMEKIMPKSLSSFKVFGLKSIFVTAFQEPLTCLLTVNNALESRFPSWPQEGRGYLSHTGGHVCLLNLLQAWFRVLLAY